MDAVHALSVFFSGLAAGALVAVLGAVLPTWRALSAEAALRSKQGFDPRMDRITPPLTFAALVLAVVLLVAGDDPSSTEAALTAVGVAGMAGVAIVSGAYNMRINRRMAGWSPESVEEQTVRDQLDAWARGHAVRTLSALIGFAALTAALVS